MNVRIMYRSSTPSAARHPVCAADTPKFNMENNMIYKPKVRFPKWCRCAARTIRGFK